MYSPKPRSGQGPVPGFRLIAFLVGFGFGLFAGVFLTVFALWSRL